MSTIWKAIDLDEYNQGTLNDDDVQFVESYFNVKLPIEYKKLLKERNGGELDYQSHPYQYQGEPLDVRYIVGVSKKKNIGLLSSGYLAKEWNLPKGLIIFSGEAPVWICMDYRNRDRDPEIVLYDAEIGEQSLLNLSFGEFIKSLYQARSTDNSEELFTDDLPSFSYKEAEKIFRGNSVGEISTALHYFCQVDCDTNWLLNQLVKLSKKKNEFIVQDVAEILYRIIDKRLGSENMNSVVIKELINTLRDHTDDAVQAFSIQIEGLYKKKVL